jgi:hypothetical protein
MYEGMFYSYLVGNGSYDLSTALDTDNEIEQNINCHFLLIRIRRLWKMAIKDKNNVKRTRLKILHLSLKILCWCFPRKHYFAK